MRWRFVADMGRENPEMLIWKVTIIFMYFFAVVFLCFFNSILWKRLCVINNEMCRALCLIGLMSWCLFLICNKVDLC